jgi:hypothetical protein
VIRAVGKVFCREGERSGQTRSSCGCEPGFGGHERRAGFQLRHYSAFWVAFLLPLLLAAEPPRLNTTVTPPPRTRVIGVQDPSATENYRPVPSRVRILVDKGIARFTGHTTAPAAWRSLISTNDVVGIKVYTAPGSQVGTRVAVVDAIAEGLVEAGLPKTNIVVWDRRLSDLRRAGFGVLEQKHGLRLAGSIESGWDTNAFYESSFLGQLVYGDMEFQRTEANVGRKSYVTKLLTTNFTKIINVAPLLNHNSSGVCGTLYSMALGSIDNSLRFEGDPAKLALSVPEIYALPQLSERIVLHIVDALICQYQGEQIGHLHYSSALNQVRFSTDPVALDALSIEELSQQRAAVQHQEFSRTNGLHLLRNAEILELGIADKDRIDFELHTEPRASAPFSRPAIAPAE